jgi:hypothetical protein
METYAPLFDDLGPAWHKRFTFQQKQHLALSRPFNAMQGGHRHCTLSAASAIKKPNI